MIASTLSLVKASILEYQWERTDDPKEGRDERNKRMPVCVLHALEMSSE
jgi:hypothetical protein